MKWTALLIAAAAVAIAISVALMRPTWQITLSPTLEDRLPNGALYNPNTQSFLRESHWLDGVKQGTISVASDGQAEIYLREPDAGHALLVRNLPLHWIVPRLHYKPASPPDRFDAFNLLLAEYSRNSLSVPVGKSSDAMAHFETDMDEAVPWTLDGDYGFVPNPHTRPVRFSVINNCLGPGLWELNASDRTGEIYHAWFNMPEARYTELVAKANGVEVPFASAAIKWNNDPVPLELDRLRTPRQEQTTADLSLIGDLPAGFSSQDSRRKLHKHFVEVKKGEQWVSPQWVKDLTAGVSRFSNFIEPGKYSITDRKEFDLRFLRDIRSAGIRRVTPLTHYNWRRVGKVEQTEQAAMSCVELTLNLAEYCIVIGNLPLSLLVPQEDLAINGFGVGVLASGGLAERRRYRIENGPPPSFAYLCKEQDGRLLGLNSHDFGIEQIFIRTHSPSNDPWWEITITSYERIADIVKYCIDVPAEFHAEINTAALEYVSPLYRTYRDDNLR